MPFDSGSRHVDFGVLRAVLIDHVELLAETLLGAHSKTHSNRITRRWGSKGSLALVVSGPKRGAWHSHEFGEGGGPIELIGFARSCGFDEAVAWATHWAGMAPASDIDQAQRQVHNEQRRRDREQRQARREVEEAADRRDRISRAQRLLRLTVSIDGTVAEAYLQNTRHIPRPAGGWPECLRFLPDRTVTLPVEGWPKLQTAGALVLVATLPNGTVTGAQRIYLTADAGNLQDDGGRKVKLSIGVLDGAAARLPGSDDGPLLFAEGPETALSAWVATGHATHAALGGMGNHRLPAGRRVVLCRDDDVANSPADKALHRLLKVWRDVGSDVVVATPWSVRRGDKSDLNDTLREGGPDAVRIQIATALNPGDGQGPPVRVPIDEGRRLLGTAIEAFFIVAVPWDDRQDGLSAPHPPESEDDYGVDGTAHDAPPAGSPVHLVQIDTGGGKSDAARRAAARALAAMRDAGDTRSIAMAVPTHELGSEQLAQFEALPAVQTAGLTARIWRGRRADDPASPGQTMCKNLELLRQVHALKLDVTKQACGICPHGPNGSGDCAYLAQRSQRADLWFVAHNMIFEAKPKAMGQLAALIVDESPLSAALDGVEWMSRNGRAHPSVTLLLEVLARVDRADGGPIDTDRLTFLRRRALDAIDAQGDGPLMRQAFKDADFTAASAAEARRLEWRTRVEVQLSATMSPAERQAALAKASSNGDLGRRAMFWDAVQAMLSPYGPEFSGWCTRATDADVKSDKPARYLDLKRRRELGKAWRVPTLVLDATSRTELLRHLWPCIQQTADVRLQAPHQRVRQTIDRDQALSRLDVGAARSDAERRHRRRILRDLHAVICREARALAPATVLVVAQQRVEAALLAMGNLPANIEMAHHNAIRGIDRWGDVAALIVLGRTLPPSTTIRRMTEALTGVAQASEDYQRAQVVRELSDGRMQPGEWSRYGDAIGEALRWQCCEAEVMQIIGRARGVNRTAINPVSVLVLTDVVLPLPVEPITLDSLDPSPADLMMAAGGMVLTNPSDAAAAYPHLWGNREAAKKAMQRARLGTNPYKDDFSIRVCPQPLRVDYQRMGAGRSAAVAWCDLTLVPDPAGNLARAIGSLVWCRVAGYQVTLLGGEAGMDEAAVMARPDVDKLAIRARLQVGCETAVADATACCHDGGHGDPLPAQQVLPVIPQTPVQILGEGDLAGLRLRCAMEPTPIIKALPSLSARGIARPKATATLS